MQKKKNTKLLDKSKPTEREVMDFDNIKNDDKTLNVLTGVSNVHLFKWLLSLVKPNVELTTKSISHENHLLLVLMKLRHGYVNKDLALTFNTLESPIRYFEKLYFMARKGNIT